MSKQLKRLVLPVSSIFSVLILIAGIICLQFSRYQQLKYAGTKSINSDNSRNVEQLEKRSATQQLKLLRVLPKFGYKNLFADWIFLNFIQYFGDFDLRKSTGYHLSINYFENIVDIDPYFIESYVFLVNSISMYAGQPQETIRLLETGLKSMAPNVPKRSYLIWRHKGTDELLFVGDTKSAQISYRQAAAWAEKSFDKEAPLVARLSRKTAKFLETDPNSKSAQIGAWSDVLLRATDDNIRRKAITQIEALGGTVLAAENGQVTVRYKTNDE